MDQKVSNSLNTWVPDIKKQLTGQFWRMIGNQYFILKTDNKGKESSK